MTERSRTASNASEQREMSTTRKQAITKTDRAERNRLAQQAHQQRKRDRLRNLEAQVKYLETLLESKGNMCLTDCSEPPISNSGELASGITPSVSILDPTLLCIQCICPICAEQ
ncbi:hypothetical protein BCR33DRAFT_503494 [Rhizoclosmatium globosum]|uniref:BZIP domain-containing protein n=1 Tax=Rhizoclosmatium globosum TaxID=329046 RepID=A0A1Y2CVN5_9FUNG|nr:hypothetical protein BCR33DRAFT_503494 [Rhizoclosmatium globosum]|eukprot:ORY51129.1 hypothetical protein BCR33DRAFT_503494 [Rhizoclosmatium globosum]